MERSRKPSLPGQVLMELYLAPQNTSLAAFAERTGICIRELSALVHGSMPVTQDIALRLARALNTIPALWLNMQKSVDLWIANRESRKQELESASLRHWSIDSDLSLQAGLATSSESPDEESQAPLCLLKKAISWRRSTPLI